jgi:hypothetical protein
MRPRHQPGLPVRAGPKAHRRPSYEPWRGIPMTATLIVLTLLFVVEIGWLVRF